MHTTKKGRSTVAPKASRVVVSSPAENIAASMAEIATAAANVRTSIAALESSAAVRLLLVELERYERTVMRWSTFPPSEAQCEALADELTALELRVRALVDTRRPLSERDATRATTTKLPRVT